MMLMSNPTAVPGVFKQMRPVLTMAAGAAVRASLGPTLSGQVLHGGLAAFFDRLLEEYK
jgi:hypothetical protein